MSNKNISSSPEVEILNLILKSSENSVHIENTDSSTDNDDTSSIKLSNSIDPEVTSNSSKKLRKTIVPTKKEEKEDEELNTDSESESDSESKGKQKESAYKSKPKN